MEEDTSPGRHDTVTGGGILSARILHDSRVFEGARR
jgi:hypothetical protein